MLPREGEWISETLTRLRKENDRLRQSLHEARELIEELASSGVESYNVGYMVMQVPTATLDAAHKWLEEHGDG